MLGSGETERSSLAEDVPEVEAPVFAYCSEEFTVGGPRTGGAGASVQIICLNDVQRVCIVRAVDRIDPSTAVGGAKGECVGMVGMWTRGKKIDLGNLLRFCDERVPLIRRGMNADSPVKPAGD